MRKLHGICGLPGVMVSSHSPRLLTAGAMISHTWGKKIVKVSGYGYELFTLHRCGIWLLKVTKNISCEMTGMNQIISQKVLLSNAAKTEREKDQNGGSHKLQQKRSNLHMCCRNWWPYEERTAHRRDRWPTRRVGLKGSQRSRCSTYTKGYKPGVIIEKNNPTRSS